jgi:hypothetical protein
VCQNETLRFGVTNREASNATYTWTASSGTQSTSTYTFNTSGNGAKTATVYVRKLDGGVTCQSPASDKVTANVQALPAKPDITRVNTAATVCQNTNVVFRVTTPVTGATYTWSANPTGTASGTGNCSYTVSGTATGVKAVSVYSKVQAGGVTCQSPNGDQVSTMVTGPGAAGSSSACGCANELVVCNDKCWHACHSYEILDLYEDELTYWLPDPDLNDIRLWCSTTRVDCSWHVYQYYPTAKESLRCVYCVNADCSSIEYDPCSPDLNPTIVKLLDAPY